MKKPLLILLYGGIAVFAVAWFKVTSALVERGAPVERPPSAPASLPPRKLPDFQLTDQRGQPVPLADLKGKVWVANFFFSSCPGPCLDLTRRVREIDQALGSRDDVRLVSFSIDPKNDTPEALAAYAQKNGASSRWLFLTGERPITAKVGGEGFLLALSPDPAEFTHSDKLVVVDREGNARVWIDSHAPDAVAQVSKAVNELPHQ